jgi:hypothetical protein
VNRRERLRRCYYHEELDRPAVYSRTNYPPDDPSYDGLRAYLAENAEQKHIWNGCRRADEPPTEQRVEPISEDWERHVTVLHTPAGDLTASRRVSLKGQPGLGESWFVSSREETERYLSLPDPVFRDEVESFFEADRRMGDSGIAQAMLGANPAGFVADHVCGSENFALLSVTDRDVIHELCRRRMEALLERVKFLLAEGVGPYFGIAGQEFLTPPLHGPRDFDDFNVRYDRPIFDLIHEGGGRVHVHCHGSIRRVFDGFLDAGVDVLHPFEAPPCGDISPAEAKERARGRMCMEGNIQIADMYEASPEEVRRQTEALIEDCFDDRCGLIVSPTASPYIRGAGEECLPRYRAMVEAVLEWSP